MVFPVPGHLPKFFVRFSDGVIRQENPGCHLHVVNAFTHFKFVAPMTTANYLFFRIHDVVHGEQDWFLSGFGRWCG